MNQPALLANREVRHSLRASIAFTSNNHAQYSTDWSKIAGGVYAVRGTIGQLDAGGPMTNGQYSVVGGFWALPTLVQPPGAPTLCMTNAVPGFATICWTPPSPGFTLRSSDDLSPPIWVNVPSGTNNPAPVPATSAARSYRLFKPRRPQTKDPIPL